MKKLRTDTGGYALIHVLIIVLVLCAVAVTICTAALENYQEQEDSVRQTQQLYQAEARQVPGGGGKLLNGFCGIQHGKRRNGQCERCVQRLLNRSGQRIYLDP